MNKLIDELTSDFLVDWEEHKDAEYARQVVWMHIYKAYNIGQGNDGSKLREEWYETVDKDVDYINEHSEVIDLDWEK